MRRRSHTYHTMTALTKKLWNPRQCNRCRCSATAPGIGRLEATTNRITGAQSMIGVQRPGVNESYAVHASEFMSALGGMVKDIRWRKSLRSGCLGLTRSDIGYGEQQRADAQRNQSLVHCGHGVNASSRLQSYASAAVNEMDGNGRQRDSAKIVLLTCERSQSTSN